VETPLYDAFGNGIDSGYYTGDFDPAVWLNPESQRYLELIALIPNPSPEEKRNIALLAYLEKFDTLTGLVVSDPQPRDTYVLIGPDIASIEAVCGQINPAWLDSRTFYSEEIPPSKDWEAPPGTTITLDTCVVKVVNILPSTILGVYAYYTDKNLRSLQPVPSRYYRIETPNLNGINPTVLILDNPLSENPGWEDEIYVTYQSSVGPEVPNIIEHLVDTYTDKTIDTTSFSNVLTAFSDKYPANFVFYDRPNAIEAINRVAWEARCAATLRNNQVYLTYLAQEPTPVGPGLIDTTILIGTEKLNTVSTEQLITRYNVTWRKNGIDKPEKLTLRNNIPLYQLKEQNIDILIFDKYDLVHKTVNFWLMRNSNLFYQLTCQTIMSGINYEILDGCTTPYRVGRVIEWSYNHEFREVEITVETPFRYGEDTEYPYYWPAALDPGIDWPGIEDNPGGYGPGTEVSGTISCEE
jgi:hypothetical protein